MNEQGLKDRLKNIAKEQGKRFNEVWKKLVLERLLVRISHSEYSGNFVFKGGLLLSHYIEIGRETKDADFLANFLSAQENIIQKAFERICKQKAPDGFIFSFSGITLLEQPHMNYPGFRVNLDVGFGKMKDKIQIDVGVGDVVEPIRESLELFQYKEKPVFEGSVTLQVYPVETIFAEKLETIVSKGAANSRMKDYHDLFLLCKEEGLIDVTKLKLNMVNTFSNRNTVLDLPIKFSPDALLALNKLWVAHVRGLGPIAEDLNIPGEIAILIDSINVWLDREGVI